MKKSIYTWFALPLLLLLFFLAACGSATAQQSNQPGPTPPVTSGELYILDNAGQAATSRHIVALSVSGAHPAPRLTLPAGLTDLKHQWLYVASPAAGAEAHTTISVLDTRSGTPARTFTIAGSYSTADQGTTDSMLAGNGRWLALREQHAPAGTTVIALVDTVQGKLVKTISLSGTFTLDAVSPQGTMLYLLEYYEAGTSHYNVRAYDVRAGKLLQGDIADKNDLDEKMQGAFLTRWLSADGSMAYTLYINPDLNKAFIHILWLTDSTDGTPFPMLARCADLPSGKDASLLRYYTLALSQDGQTLYAANAALGIMASLSLNPGLNDHQLWEIPAARIAHFTPDAGSSAASVQGQVLYHGAVLSPDQSRLYVAGAHGIQVLDTATLKSQSQYLKQESFTGLAISSDGKTLYAVDPASGVSLLDPASGQVRGTIQGPVHAPWGIAWTTA